MLLFLLLIHSLYLIAVVIRFWFSFLFIFGSVFLRVFDSINIYYGATSLTNSKLTKSILAVGIAPSNFQFHNRRPQVIVDLGLEGKTILLDWVKTNLVKNITKIQMFRNHLTVGVCGLITMD